MPRVPITQTAIQKLTKAIKCCFNLYHFSWLSIVRKASQIQLIQISVPSKTTVLTACCNSVAFEELLGLWHLDYCQQSNKSQEDFVNNNKFFGLKLHNLVYFNKQSLLLLYDLTLPLSYAFATCCLQVSSYKLDSTIVTLLVSAVLIFKKRSCVTYVFNGMFKF